MHIRINIHVNNKKIEIDKNSLTGSELKRIANIQENIKLYKHVPHNVDLEILNETTYTIESGMVFYTEDFHEEIKIFIDHKEYRLYKNEMTGAELKAIANIPLTEYKLIKEEKESADFEIEDDVTYHIEKKDEFFSVPQGIQNGGIA